MMHVSGKIDGLRKGTLYLQKVLDSTLVDVDSLVINGNPFLNRIDDIIMFSPLTSKEIKLIVELQLNILINRLKINELSIDVTRILFHLYQ